MASTVAQRQPISSSPISAIGTKADTAVTVMLLIAFVEIGISLHRLTTLYGPSWRARATSLVSRSSMRRSTAFPFPSAVRHKKTAGPSVRPHTPDVGAREHQTVLRNRADLGLLFRCRRIDFSDPAQAVGFGRMRAGDEGSADFGRVPAGFHAEAKRFFCHDVTRREILHHVAFGWAVPSWQERAG